jgi:predicted GTPase
MKRWSNMIETTSQQNALNSQKSESEDNRTRLFDPETLRAYTKSKLSLAGRLRELREIFKRNEIRQNLQRCDELLVRLAEDRFTLAVVGQFKRGKSSLMNAIIGRELLPVGVLPLTSAITVLRYGPKERLLITREDIRLPFPQEEPVERLAEFVTENGNSGNAKHVKTACLELPIPFLRRGLEFVDTPGVGSAIEANTITTLNFLPNCDAVLFVTSVDSPLTKLELDFIGRIGRHVGKIFFVINKTDLLAQQERGAALDFVRSVISERTKTKEISVFPVSARRGLESKLSGNRLAEKESGVAELENELAVFLSSEKSSVFLAAIERSIATLEQDAESLERRRGNAIAARRLFDQPAGDVANDLRTRGCPVCNRLAKVSFEFFSKFQYEIATNQSTQKDFADSFGFCSLHFWQLAALSSPSGLSSGLAPLAEHISQKLANLADSFLEEQCAVKLHCSSSECLVCQELRRHEQGYLSELNGFVKTNAGREAYGRSQGVCLRHLALWLCASEADGFSSFLLREAALRFDHLAEDMQSFGLKNEALRRQLQNADEDDAFVRALIHIAGAKAVCFPWSTDGAV